MAKLSIFNGTNKSHSKHANGSHPSDAAGYRAEIGPEQTGTATSLLSEAHFRRMLCRERKRSERSRKHLLLMLIDGKCSDNLKEEVAFLHQVANSLNDTMRETDLAGWFEADSV